ncbi:helicase-associated domain-containing protein [Spongiactinospora sp. TRM90649]|uniref:helicase-associated domain-containing protein n=1 Tax=Spongiactinospora sp. TRM90649 TaxID=3031114 RepID=UPI0023F92F71|nr:helicase-associated domain-containing protein [Spongiactinospora sp. TRM90649]MDF5755722.1 helicase-associated domain-containing protein [Spongiactinospora sp. TRM90649]
MEDHLLGWLRTLDEDRLARLLANRPDAIAAPWPRRLDTLAQRLGNGFAVMEALRGLPLPCLETAQACAVLGGSPTPAELARLLDVREEDVRPWLDRLFDHALGWPDDDGRVHLAQAVSRWWAAPCGLGEPLSSYLNSWTISTDALRSLARGLGVASHGPKRRVAAKVTEILTDPAQVEALLETAPAGGRKLAEEFAWDGPVRDVDGGRFVTPGTPEKWAADHGLLYRPSWNVAEMPREVALAVRGPGYHPPLTQAPPELATLPVDPEEVDHLMALAAPHVVERCAALLDNTAKTPLPLLKSGGVGVREVRRVAKETACDEDETRLLLEICAVARLLAWDEGAGGLVPTDRFDHWRLDDGAARLRTLLSAWWRMERSSLRRVDGKYTTVLGDDSAGPMIARIRRSVLGVLAGLPAATAHTSRAELVRHVHWYAPTLDIALLAEITPAVLDEARLLGLIAHDAITDLGRALAVLDRLAGSENDDCSPAVEHDPALVECSARALASVRRSALFGADLTAVVTGPPSAELAALLDRAADRESRGAASASVWRFSRQSVRRALDAGDTPEGLLDDLATVGTVPQPLNYLIHDVARRHGEVTVTTVSCIVQASDPVLLAEIAANRRLSRLGLRVLAPTVLAGSAPADRTLAALREAGYAPVPVDDTGEITIRRAKIEEPQGGRLILLPGGQVAELEAPPGALMEPVPDPREHARRLLTMGDPERQQGGRTWAVIGRNATRLPTAQQSLLGFVVDRGVRAAITLTDGLTATISHGELRPGVLDAWCEEAGDYLEFPLAEIVEVRGSHV